MDKRDSQLVLCIVSIALFSAGARAQSDLAGVSETRDQGIFSRVHREPFSAREWTLDVSGHWERSHDNVDAFFTDSSNDVWGGGLGVNYFFTRQFGLGVNGNANDNGGAFIDNAAADVVMRFPIDSISTAPYLIGGAGRVFQPSSLWEAHAGLGVEFRLSHRLGVFTDARYLWVENGSDRSQVRVGFRIAF